MTERPGISKYFIAIVPPSAVAEQALHWKEFFKTEFNSKAALNSPPHITVHMPFEWKSEKENRLLENLTQFARTQKSFDLRLNDFGCFSPRVIFIQVVENPALRGFQSSLARFCKTELNLFNANRFDHPFHPHLTVAFRDLKKSIFPKAWDAVKDISFSASYKVENFSLLKYNGKIWEILSSFPLMD